MSSAPGDSGPSCFIDQSHNDMSYGNYTNKGGYHASGYGKLSVANYQYGDSSSPLEELENHCSHSAAFDSAARFDPPRCAKSTRLQINQTIQEWIDNDVDTSTLFWLHGGAGAGKSAVAQSLSEKFQEKEHLAASFFFFRSDATRNNGDHLIPTLVSHLVDSFEGLSSFVEDKIRKHRAIFTKNYQIQIQELLVEPLLSLKSKGTPHTHPRLIVIDGLDECENPDVQCELLRVIALAITHIPYPLRFFITSRPEAHIMRVFHHDTDLQAIPLRKYNLSDDPDADRDIRKFLKKEFRKIRKVHSLGQHLPNAWPHPKVITSLVDRSSGHFIYASTVIRYIGSPKHRPDDRLEVILRLRPPRDGDKPYAQLDALYTFIFHCVEDHGQLEKICLVLGMLYFQSNRTGWFSMTAASPSAIEGYLGMKAGDLGLLLDPILSLVAINSDQLRILQKSLFDYLLDYKRRGHLPINFAQVHEVAATYLLRQWNSNRKWVANTFELFAYHCQFASLNDTLKDYLHSMEVPPPQSVLIELRYPSMDVWENESLLRIMWFFFRTLNREDFDSTGQVYEQYTAKWMGFLHSPFTERTEHKMSKVNRFKCWLKRKLSKSLKTESKPAIPAELVKLKHEFETMLMQWKPKSFQVNPVDVGMDPKRLIALVKREQDVFLAFTKKIFFHSNAVISSIVFGDDFIHSYELVFKAHAFLNLRTYSKNGNMYNLLRSVDWQENLSQGGLKIEQFKFSLTFSKSMD